MKSLRGLNWKSVQGLNLFNQIALIYAFCVICVLVMQVAPLELIVFMCLIFYKQNTPTELYFINTEYKLSICLSFTRNSRWLMLRRNILFVANRDSNAPSSVGATCFRCVIPDHLGSLALKMNKFSQIRFVKLNIIY